MDKTGRRLALAMLTVVVVEIAPQVRVKVNRGQIAGLAGGAPEPPQAAAPKKATAKKGQEEPPAEEK